MNTPVDILLVEDNIYDAELTMLALREVNLANNVIHARDGEEALQIIFGDTNNQTDALIHPRLILLDLKMPKVDGMEVLMQLKSNQSTKAIPVVIMTSSKEEQDIIETYNLGVNSFIVKPLVFSEFADTVSRLGLYWLLLNQAPFTPNRNMHE